MRILALDIGERRIGVALSDPEEVLAIPLATIASKSEDADFTAILELVRQHGVERIVVGLPYSMDGSVGRQAEQVQDFVNRLSQRMPVPVVTWDERLSTVAAGKMLRDAETRKSRRKDRKEKLDATAAAIILQAYLDSLQNQTNKSG